MESTKVYQRKSTYMKDGNATEKEPEIQHNFSPNTPAKPTAERPKKVYLKRHSKNSSGICLLARISAEDACSGVSELSTATTSMDKNNGLIDLNRSICDWEDGDVAASCSSKDTGESGRGLFEATLASKQVTENHGGQVIDSSGDSSKGVFNWEETSNGLGDTKAFNDIVAKSLDFSAFGTVNEGLDDWEAPLAGIPFTQLLSSPTVSTPPAFEASTNATTQGEVNWSSDFLVSLSAKTLGATDSITTTLPQVLASQVDRSNPKLDRLSFLPENHSLLLGSYLQKNNKRTETVASQNLNADDRENDVQDNMISCVENEKFHHVQRLEVIEPVFSATTSPLLGHGANKRPNNGVDLNKQPHRRFKRKRHRPKILVEGKSKRAQKQMLNVAPKCPSEKKVKREYIRKSVSEKRETKEKRKYARKTVSEKSETKEKRKCVRETLSEKRGKRKEDSITEHHTEIAENKPNTDNRIVMEIDLNHESKLSDELGIKSMVQPSMDKNFGALTLLSSDQLRWNTHGTRSVGECCRNPYIRNSYQRIVKVNPCLSYSRKVGPNFPNKCKNKRTKRRRKLNLFSPCAFSQCHKKRKRRKSLPRANFAPLWALPICNQMLLQSTIPGQTHLCQEIENSHELQTEIVFSHELEPCKDPWGQALTNKKNVNQGSSGTNPLEHILNGEEQGSEIVDKHEEGNCGEEQEFQVAEEVEEENCENNVTETHIGIGVSLKQPSTGEGHQIQIIHVVKAEMPDKNASKGSIEMGLPPVNLEMRAGKSKRSLLQHEGSQIVVKSRGPQKAPGGEHVAISKVTAATIKSIIRKFESLKIKDIDTLVPYKGSKRRTLPKVDIDLETLRIWKQLMKIDDGVGEEKADKEKEKWWEAEREVFRGRIDSFTSRMHLILGDRRFKAWKGSVVDSVVGVFLTQNVSDKLSSSAYMSLAAKFPLQSTSNQELSNEEVGIMHSHEPIGGSNKMHIGPTYDSQGNHYFVTEPEPDMNHELENHRENPSDGAEGTNLGDVNHVLENQVETPSDRADGASLVDTDHGLENQIETPLDKAEETSLVDIEDTGVQHFGKFILPQESNSYGNKILPCENPENVPRGMECIDQTSCSDRLNIVKATHTPISQSDFCYPFETSLCSSNACHRSNSIGVMEDSGTDIVVQQKFPLEAQKTMTVDPYFSLGKSHMPEVCNSQAEAVTERNSHTSNCHEGQRVLNFQSNNIPADKSISLLHEMINTQGGTLEPDCDAAVKNKRQRGKKHKLDEQSNLSEIATADTRKTTPRGKNRMAKEKEVEKRDWDSLRKIYSKPRSRDQMDSVDWEAVRSAELSEVAEAIKDRGQQTIIAGRIQDFLNRVVELHKSIDLEWLRYAPPDDVKEYLLEIQGLGLKSVECVRLLALQHIAFPVDTNVGRIAVRLGWVPLQPLPGNLQFHLLEEYPLMDSIQKYLWPRLCMLDQQTLYELHYQMITFGKVFCTKRDPNCNACPMRAECRHFASRIASENLSLPGPSEKGVVRSTAPGIPVRDSASRGKNAAPANPISVSLLEYNTASSASGSKTQSCEPIVEEPKSPEREQDIEDSKDIEDFDSDDEEIPTIKLNNEVFNANVRKFLDMYGSNIQDGNSSQALVLLSVETASLPTKHYSRLRTEHLVYEIPDNHVLLEGLKKRERDDPVHYLLAIWTPGETADSCRPPKRRCNYQGSELCNDQTCFYCESIREQKADIVRGTILIPCRTANNGQFPLNGTYFQVNEVFADHESSYNPIIVPRRLIWNLPRWILYVGTSVSAIFRDLDTKRIQTNFWRGFICVRGFDKGTGDSKPLSKRFHCPPSKMEKLK